MTDLSNLSDDELTALYSKSSAPPSISPAAPTDLSKMSDAELIAAHAAATAEKPTATADALKEGAKGIGRGLAGAAGDVGEAIAGPFGPSHHLANLMADLGLGERPKDEPGYGQQITKAAGIEASPQTTAGKYAGTVGEFVGNPETYLGPGGALAKVVTAAAGAVGSQAAGDVAAKFAPDSAKTQAAARLIGAIAGGHGTTIAPRLVSPNVISGEQQAMLNTLRNEGVTATTAGQRIGSKPLKYTESVMADQPYAGRNPEQINDQVANQFTSAALRRVGEDANRATPEVVDRAFNRIGNQFETIGARNQVIPDAQLVQDLRDARAEYHNLVGPNSRAPVVKNTIADLANQMQGGTLSGAQYNAITSRLARQARSSVNDPQLHGALSDLREAIDDAFQRTLQRNGNTADLAGLQQARRQYRNLMVIEKAATSGGAENVGKGIITPAALSNAVKNTFGRRSFARGSDDFTDLARAGTGVLTPLPQSGTAPRENIIHHLQLAGLLAAEPTAAAAHAGPLGMTAAAIAGLVAPAISGRVLMSHPVQRYLSNQAAPYRFETSPSTIALMNAIRGGQTPQLPAPGRQQ